MECPKCTAPMQPQTFKEVTLDRCTHCFGIFCSPETIERTKTIWLAERVLDIGYQSTGERYDKMDDIRCPTCDIAMEKISDPEQTHIWIEECPQCQHVFLDAGELTDLKFNNILDRLRDWRKGARR